MKHADEVPTSQVQVGKAGKGARVVAVSPFLLNESDAAVFLGKSASWLRTRRMLDLALLRAGEHPTGPRWCVLDRSVMYRLHDLREWAEGLLVEHGRTPFRGNIREGA